jgi:adenylate cyclase
VRVANVKFLPVWITTGVVLLLLLARAGLDHLPALNFIEQVELFSYDARARLALQFEAPVATNLAVIGIEDECIERLNQSDLGGVRWMWPRFVFAKALEECKAQGAAAVAMDMFFFDLDHDGPVSELGGLNEDEYLAKQMANAGNVLLATTARNLEGDLVEVMPIPAIFRTNAFGIGQDGVPRWSIANRERFRRVPAFVVDQVSGQRIWHLGLLLAARTAGMNLENAVVEPGRIRLQMPKRGEVVIPVDDYQRFYIDWRVLPAGPQTPSIVEQESFFWLYLNGRMRDRGMKGLENVLAGRAVVIGSVASGVNVYDRGATPVSDNVPLLFSLVNAANSLLTGRFVQRAGRVTEFWVMVVCAVLAALVGWRLRSVWGVGILLLGALAYVAFATWLYVKWRYWLPVVMPLGGAALMYGVWLLTYRLVIERETRTSFGRLVSPNVFERLAKKPASVLSNTRKPVSVYFADLRGFTRFVEANHARTQARLREHRLEGPPAEAVIEADAREGLATVNLYVGRIADVVKANDGTLDKYIGDCVMSFWGAPIRDERHAVNCVQAAIEVHRAIQRVNEARQAVNLKRSEENSRRAAGEATQELLPVLSVGSAINSGIVTVGFMGSAAHMSNYTVFGREVNIASRLEHQAGGDRIIVTEATFREVERHEPRLAKTFLPLGPMLLEGIPEPVEVFEVPWRLVEVAP